MLASREQPEPDDVGILRLPLQLEEEACHQACIQHGWEGSIPKMGTPAV